jgi:hypothetical protein
VLTIFRDFDLTAIPPDVHPLTHLTNLIHNKGTWKPRPEPKSWFATPETAQQSLTITRLRTEARKYHRALVERGDITKFADFVEARSNWIKAVDEGRKLAASSFQTRLAAWQKNPNTPGYASRLWKVMSGKKSEFGTSIPEDELVSHFNALLFKSTPLTYTPVDPPTLDPFLDTPFTEAEVLRAIHSKSPSSAPGADQLQYSFWKSVVEDPESLTLLTSLFNHVYTTGVVPPDWHTAVVTMLYKGKGPRNMATNFRAISLTATSLKIFETLLASRISSWASTRKILTYHQAGFRSHYSTYDHVFTLASIQRRAGKNNVFVGFIDLAKAFPSVSRPKLLSKLQNLGLSTKALNVIADMYSVDSYQFILSRNSIGTSRGQADTGTREGSCLSPLLFLLFVHDLPEFLDACGSWGPKFGGKVLRVLQFADDTTLIAHGRTQFQILLDRFALYCDLNELKINASKTEIINLRKGSRPSRKDHWKLNNVPLRVSSSARYLGVMFNSGRFGVSHVKHLRTRNLTKVWGLVGRIKRAGFTDIPFIKNLFRVLIISSATYGAGLLLPLPKPYLAKNLDCLQTNFLRSVWSLPRGTPNHFVLKVANLPCMSCVCLEEALRFLTRKLRNWGINSPIVEELITDMLAGRGSAEDPPSPSWLDHLTGYIVNDLNLPLPRATVAELRSSMLALDPVYLRQRITERCHATCYPPSPNREPMYQSLQLSSAASWPCFQTAAPHFKLCRFFASDSFCHSRLLHANEIDRTCNECGIPLTIDHWLHCPLRISDRALLASEVGFPIDSMEKLREIFMDQRHSVALEFVLSKFFKW